MSVNELVRPELTSMPGTTINYKVNIIYFGKTVITGKGNSWRCSRKAQLDFTAFLCLILKTGL